MIILASRRNNTYDKHFHTLRRKNLKPLILTGTFFWVAMTAVSTPFRATEVSPPWLIALNAYSEKTRKMSLNKPVDCRVIVPLRSFCFKNPTPKPKTNFMQIEKFFKNTDYQNIPTWYSLPSGENIVICLSNPALLPRAMFQRNNNLASDDMNKDHTHQNNKTRTVGATVTYIQRQPNCGQLNWNQEFQMRSFARDDVSSDHNVQIWNDWKCITKIHTCSTILCDLYEFWMTVVYNEQRLLYQRLRYHLWLANKNFYRTMLEGIMEFNRDGESGEIRFYLSYNWGLSIWSNSLFMSN